MGLRRVAALLMSVGALLVPFGSAGHEWYPRECCGNGDCAPADSVERLDDGSYLVTAHGMVTTIPADYPKWRRSPDARMHVCIRKLRSGAEYLVCAFRGPGV